MSEAPLVSVEDLTVKFVSREAAVHAVNGVSFALAKGEVLGILGESGSGKSATLRAVNMNPILPFPCPLCVLRVLRG